jgi:hypothetical protein
MRRESKVIKQEHAETQWKLTKVRVERLKLEDLIMQQQQEKVELQKKVLNLKPPSILKGNKGEALLGLLLRSWKPPNKRPSLSSN